VATLELLSQVKPLSDIRASHIENEERMACHVGFFGYKRFAVLSFHELVE